MSHALDLGLRIDVEPNRVVVHYRVKSREARVAYLLNLLHLGTPESIDTELSYVDLDRATRTVIVSKRIADIPTDRNVYEPVAPYVSRIAPGADFAESFAVAVPIRERREYDDPAPQVTLEEYTSLRVRLGYYLVPDGTREDIEEVPGRRILLPRLPQGQRPEFGELSAQESGLRLQVFEPAP